jgi:polar amino acid transport system substrate-binding protein
VKQFFFFFMLFWAFSSPLKAQDSTLVIGLKTTPPFVIQEANGRPAGLSLAFWELIDDKIPARIEYRWFDDLDEMLKAVANNELDLSINPITVTEKRMDSLDFSQPFFISGTTAARKEVSSWTGFFENLFSREFFSAIAILAAVIFVFGFMVWLFERRKNPEQFAPGWQGILDGFWWSAVTMTTVGYGDKSPISRGGRFIGLIWMFSAILLISGLTAGVASALTVNNIERKINGIEDLRRFESGSIRGSGTAEYLEIYGLPNRYFEDVNAGLEAVQQGKVDVFLFDRPILQFYLERGDYQDLVLDHRNLKTDYYSFTYPKGSPLREALDPKIVRALKSDSWNFILRKASRNEND